MVQVELQVLAVLQVRQVLVGLQVRMEQVVPQDLQV